MADVDVVIVGAGPAGSAAAIQCRAGALRVALVERAAFPRDRPGETLHPGVEPLFGRLDVQAAVDAQGFLRHAGVWVEWNRPQRFEPYGSDRHGPWRGFQAWRAQLDAVLLGRARDLGAQVLQPCPVFSPLIEDGRVAGVHTSLGPIKARCVVDAGGGSHWLGRQLGVRLRRYSPRLFVRYGYFSSEDGQAQEAPSFRALPDGWQWIAAVGSGRSHWAQLSWTGSTPERCAPPALPGESCMQQPVRTADVSWRILERVAGPGFFAAGDSAAVLDPASSHGVLRAIMSGMMVGHSAQCALQHPRRSIAVAQRYDAWMRSWFLSDVEHLQELYRSHPVPPVWLPAPSRIRPVATDGDASDA